MQHFVDGRAAIWFNKTENEESLLKPDKIVELCKNIKWTFLSFSFISFVQFRH